MTTETQTGFHALTLLTVVPNILLSSLDVICLKYHSSASEKNGTPKLDIT